MPPTADGRAVIVTDSGHIILSDRSAGNDSPSREQAKEAGRERQINATDTS